MFRVANKMIGDQNAVSDILQEIFIDLYNKLNNGNEIHHPKSWLYKATFNKCVDNYRKKKRYQSIDTIRDYKAEAESSDRQEARAAINLAMSKLKPRERNLVVLYGEGLSYKEIAAATGIRLSSIGKTLSRTLKKIENEFKIKDMSCIKDDLIQKYIDGEANGKEVVRIESHISSCLACAIKIEHQQRLSGNIKNAVNQLAGNNAEIPEIIPTAGHHKRFLFPGRKIAYGLAVACIILVILIIFQKKEPEQQDVIIMVPGFAGDVDANRPISKQPLVIYIIESDGRVSEYFTGQVDVSE